MTTPTDPASDAAMRAGMEGLIVAMKERAASPSPGVPGSEVTLPPSDGHDEQAPTTIGRFQVLRMLGAGGMGVVYLAQDPSLGRKVAIKLLHVERARRVDAQARLQREARALASLSHPNVVVVYEVGVHEGQVYLVMEHVAGRTLREWTRAHCMDWQAIVGQYRAAGEGLAAAHRAGIIHRDFKPDNVLVDEDGRPRVLDFGLAAAEVGSSTRDEVSWEQLGDVDLTKTGTILGTPAYMAPEQFLGGTMDARTDQFSFCVALWEALLGRRPFEGETLLALRRRVLSGRRPGAPSRTRVPRAIVAALARGLSIDPDRRFASMSELLAVLANPRPSRRRAWIAVGLVSVGAVAAAASLLREPESTAAHGLDASSSPATPAAEPTEPAVTPSFPTLPMRRLTHTSDRGVTNATFDRKGTILYSMVDASGNQEWWLLSPSSAEPRRLHIPLPGAPFFGPDGNYWTVEVDGISRVHPDGTSERVIDRRVRDDGSIDASWPSPDGTAVAVMNGSRLQVWSLAEPDREPLRIEAGGRLIGLAWSPDGKRIGTTLTDEQGTRTDIFDAAAGGLLSSTSWSWLADATPSLGMAWSPAGLVMLIFGGNETWVQCLAVTSTGIAPGRRSGGLATKTPELALLGMIGHRTLIVRASTTHDRLLVFDRTTEPVRLLPLSPGTHHSRPGLVWSSENELMILTKDPPGGLARVHLDDPQRLDAIAPGPYDSLTSDGEGGLVLSSPDGRVVYHWERGAASPRAQQIGLAMSWRGARCTSPRECLILSKSPGAAFFGLDLEQGHVRRLFPCPDGCQCFRGHWGSPHEGDELIFACEDHELARFHHETGAHLGELPPVPPWLFPQFVTRTSRGEILVAGMRERGSPPGGDPNHVYLLVQLDDDGEYRLLWSDGNMWLHYPRASPSGRSLAMGGRSWHAELWTMELGSLCEDPR